VVWSLGSTKVSPGCKDRRVDFVAVIECPPHDRLLGKPLLHPPSLWGYYAVQDDPYLLIVDVTMCKVTPIILHGVVSPDSLHHLVSVLLRSEPTQEKGDRVRGRSSSVKQLALCVTERAPFLHHPMQVNFSRRKVHSKAGRPERSKPTPSTLNSQHQTLNLRPSILSPSSNP
jgi:hypothetical protein